MNEDASEVKLHAIDYWQIVRNRYGVILLAFFLVFMTACVVTYILPKEYEGKVEVEIKRDVDMIEVGEDRSAPFSLTGLSWTQTQFRIIESKETLKKVIDDLGLTQKWGQNDEEAYNQLKGSLETNEVRGTELIKIIVYRQDAEEAAQLANAIADSYQARRKQMERSRVELSLSALDQQLDGQKDTVEQARQRMLELVEKYQLTDIGNGIGSFFGRGRNYETGTNDVVLKSKLDEFDAEKQIQTIRTQITALTGKDDDSLIREAASLDLQDSTITFWKPRYDELTVEKAKLLSSGLAARHPDVTSIEAQLAETRVILLDGVKALKGSLQTQLAIAEGSREKIKGLKKDTEALSRDERHRYIEYAEAKNDYDEQKNLLTEMRQKFIAERIDIAQPKKPIEIHERAEKSLKAAKPNVPLNLALGAIVGLGFGIGLAFFLEYLDTSVKSLDDVESYLGVPVLAVIPKDVGVLHKQSGISPDAEAYRILRTNIEFNRKSADANAVTVVSGGAGEGKSTTLVNLAYVCAQGGYNTLMIDGDLRRPKLHTFFDINNSVGLTNYLTTELALEDVILQTPVDNLYFMPSGILPADAAGILNSRRMSELITDVKNRFDLVLIDSPPILGVSDASVLASEVDLTMIVIQHRKLPRSMLMRVKQAIENVGGNLLGVVLNNVDIRSDSQYQYYTSYYTYYSPTNLASDTEPHGVASSPGKTSKSQKGKEVASEDY